MSGSGAAWEPAVEEAYDTVSQTAAAALHGLFDADGPPPAAGDPLPPLWHWLAWLPSAPQRDLGPDGHPKRGGFLPPVPLPQRMFAGGRFEFHAPAEVGGPLHRRSLVTSVTEKHGRSGDLVFVEVNHEVSAGGRAVITEVQDLVYRQGGRYTPEPPRPAGGEAEEWAWQHDLGTHPTLLFRFSALTYNAHRIHYDRVYATETEGYPGLVVHGPLQAMALAELCRRHLPGRPLRAFRFRARRPAFDGPPLRLRGRPVGDDHVELVAVDESGQPTMTAEAELHPE